MYIMYHVFSIYSPAHEHLCCFHVLVIANNAIVNIGVHVSFWIVVLSWHMSSSGIARSYGGIIFSFLVAVVIFKEPPYCSP